MTQKQFDLRNIEKPRIQSSENRIIIINKQSFRFQIAS